MHPLLVAVLALLVLVPPAAADLNVLEFGARADGVTDDTASFQKALDLAAHTPGSTVHAPAGQYRINGNLKVPASTTLRGDFIGPGGLSGTVLLLYAGKGKPGDPAAIQLSGGKSSLFGFAIRYPEQVADAAEPVPYPYAISGGHSARIEEMFLQNPYRGIDLDASHAAMVRNVWGEPLRVGIHVDHCYDIVRIENVHLWPYFTLGHPMRDWVQKNGVAFEFGRSDWQTCLNTFCYGYHTGYRFFKTAEAKPDANTTYPAGVTNGSFVGIGADCAAVGVDIEDSFAIGVSITNGAFAPFGASPNSRGVVLRGGNTGNVNLTNCTFWAVPGTLFEVQAGSLTLNGCNIHEWALHAKDAPCILQTGGRLMVQGCTFNRGGLLARLGGATSRATLSANQATDRLTVSSAIGKRLVMQGNNPAIVQARSRP